MIGESFRTVVIEYERDGQMYKVFRCCDDPEMMDFLSSDGMIESIKNLYLKKKASIVSIRKLEVAEIELLAA